VGIYFETDNMKQGNKSVANPINGRVDSFEYYLRLFPVVLILLFWHIEADWES
jgi:hypothetical protein